MAVGLVVFIAGFAFSLGPAVSTVINEIFPGNIGRGAVAVATAVDWRSAFRVSQGFLSPIGATGHTFTFWLFALFCIRGWVCIYYAVSKTRGHSLEEIQQIWGRRSSC
jgi:hypothetical protein